MDDVRRTAEERAKRPKTVPVGASFESERQRSKNALVKQLDSMDGRNVRKIAAVADAPQEEKILRVAAYLAILQKLLRRSGDHIGSHRRAVRHPGAKLNLYRPGRKAERICLRKQKPEPIFCGFQLTLRFFQDVMPVLSEGQIYS